MSSAERISKRPKTKSVTLIDLPKANTGLAIKAIHKNNTVNDKMDISKGLTIYQQMCFYQSSYSHLCSIMSINII